MKLPTDIAKRLIERIIPELPFETNKKVMRAYAELLSNMVQVDSTFNCDEILRIFNSDFDQTLHFLTST